jgi:hypothetical protein
MADAPDIAAAVDRVVLLMLERGDDGVRAFASSLRLWSEQGPGPDVVDLDVILGLKPKWRFHRALADRDAALLRLRARRCPLLSGRPAARSVIDAVARYAMAGWRHDRRDRRRPDGERGLVYDVLACGAVVPGEEQMRDLFPRDPLVHEVADAG